MAAEKDQDGRIVELLAAIKSAESLEFMTRDSKVFKASQGDRDRIILAKAAKRYAKALLDAMAGEKDHDINGADLGLSDAQCAELLAIRAEALTVLVS